MIATTAAIYVRIKVGHFVSRDILIRTIRIITNHGLWHIQRAQRLKTVAPHLKLCILDRVFVKSSLVREVLVSYEEFL